MPKYRELTEQTVRRLPRRTLGDRDKRMLAKYRKFVRGMLLNSSDRWSALELADEEVRRVATVKRWLHRVALAEDVSISVHKRGNLLLFRLADTRPD